MARVSNSTDIDPRLRDLINNPDRYFAEARERASRTATDQVLRAVRGRGRRSGKPA
jgi:hypothetical protein